jgi:hypothetical protein
MMAELSRQRLLTEMAIKPLSRQEIEALATSLLGCPLNPAVSSLLYARPSLPVLSALSASASRDSQQRVSMTCGWPRSLGAPLIPRCWPPPNSKS